MPNFSFNLISVPKLTKTLNFQSMFNDIYCIIHDTCSNKMIYTTRLNGGLYVLASPFVTLNHIPHAHSISVLHTPSLYMSQNSNLWHLRLGHTSTTKLFELNKSFPVIKSINSTSPCDVCFYAKQKRLQFSLVLMFLLLFFIWCIWIFGPPIHTIYDGIHIFLNCCG